MILGKYTTILGKNSAIFSKIGKVNLLNWDFSANWECSRSIGNFFSQLGKKWYRKPDPVLYREKSPATYISRNSPTWSNQRLLELLNFKSRLNALVRRVPPCLFWSNPL